LRRFGVRAGREVVVRGEHVVAAVVPGTAAAHHPTEAAPPWPSPRFGAGAFAGPRLPLASVAAPRARRTLFGRAVLDGAARVNHRAVLGALGWTPGTCLEPRESGGLLILAMHRFGLTGIAPEGHLRMPPKVRNLCGLELGDRVLLAADPVRGRLVVYPPAVLFEMARQRLSATPDGGLL
jgi:hypothetical protein